ncbi:MAG: hypothetical protein CVU00_11635 [Bacteroidetes bacterium HGW-Bacteroidetes-17]|jgi:hypothetical protein|nr:MAG: hypothetical protein CVU00_11635 [Bacteroidetes bacterium HGW-Bacteroidetes-17]
MKIKYIDYYVKFIFSTVSDTGECYSTTDREILKFVKYSKTGNSMTGFSIGDIINFEPEKKPFKITNILIRGLVDDTDTLKIGFDSSDCAHQQGVPKEALFIIHITIEPV